VTAFDPCNASTWPALLTAEQMAAIWQRSASRINRLAHEGRFDVAPVPKSSPRRWRKADVLRVVDPARRQSA
jgi:hypothetical protein